MECREARVGGTVMAAKKGRPSIYTIELAEAICERIAHGKALTKICKDKGMPAYQTVLRWRRDNEEFAKLYRAAKEDAADTIADQIQDVIARVESEELNPHQGRVMIDGLKWIAAKLKPGSYGDRIHQEHSGAVGGAGWVNVSTISDNAPEWLQERIKAGAGRSTDGDDGSKLH